MINIQRIFWAQMLAAVAALAIGYALGRALFVSLLIVLLGAMWFSAQQRRVSGLEGFFLTVFLLASGIGFWVGAPVWLLLIAATTTLGAWDLDHFLQRLSAAERVEYETGLGRVHLRRLGTVQGLGLLAAVLAMVVRARIPFWWETLLVLLAVIGLWQLIRFVRKQMDDE
jgi:hypothetical protein